MAGGVGSVCTGAAVSGGVVVCGGTELGDVAGACAKACVAMIITITMKRIFLFMSACLLHV